MISSRQTTVESGLNQQSEMRLTSFAMMKVALGTLGMLTIALLLALQS